MNRALKPGDVRILNLTSSSSMLMLSGFLLQIRFQFASSYTLRDFMV